ncbi:MAG: hypothetical protein R3B70_47140 [Polyangiaceae bacterium]
MSQGVFLHEPAWRQSFEGWVIVDCAVRSRDIVYLVLRQDLPHEEASAMWDFEIPTRFAGLYLAEEDLNERWSHQGLADFRRPHAGACQLPRAQGLALSVTGDVYAAGSGAKGIERVAPDVTNLLKLRRIGGSVYAVGLGREVFRRDDIGAWEKLDAGLPPISADDLSRSQGFEDMDGFAPDDIYAAGGDGDLWHFDGQAWSPRHLPSNWPLYTVCCAGDGQVYLTGEGGTIFAGRGDQWRKIWDAELSIPYNDSLWFDGKLWLASDYRVDWLVQRDDGPAVEVARNDGRRLLMRGHMDVGDGVLVIASQDEVWMFDGKDWRTLVAPY